MDGTAEDEDTLADLPAVTREGDRVWMSVQNFDDLIARLLVAEGHAERSWLRP